MSRRFTATHLAATAAFALVIGGTAGYFLAPDGTEEAVSADSSCPEISTSGGVAEAFGRLVGSGGDVRSSVSERKWLLDSYRYSCMVHVNGRGRLLLVAELADSGSVSDWKANLEENGDIGSEEANKSFTLGEKGVGVASPFSAAIYLPCKPAGSKLNIDNELNVEVSMLRRGGDADTNRSDAARVARSLASHAQHETHCENAERLPTGPIKWS